MKASRTSLVGGVSSPVRAFGVVGGRPLTITRAEGAYLWDTTGKRYLDFVLGFGSQILGHTPAVVQRVLRSAQGVQYGLNSDSEAKLANLLVRDFPSIDQVRFTTSGSEATALAVRLVRAHTGRRKVLVFRRGYHGHALAVDTDLVVLPAFDLMALKKAIAKHKPAALLAEPVLGNAGCILPPVDFWAQATKLLKCTQTLLILDEVMTGYRAAYAGYQVAYRLTPDLTCLGKIIGGGLPLAAVGGSKKIMQQLQPVGTVVHAGTFAGHPLATACGLATLTALKDKSPKIRRNALYLQRELAKLIPTCQIGAMLGFDLSTSYCLRQSSAPSFAKASVGRQDDKNKKFQRLFQSLRQKGFLLPPSPEEAFFLSAAHTRQDLQRFVEAVRLSIKS